MFSAGDASRAPGAWRTVPFAPFDAIARAYGVRAVQRARVVTTVEGEYALIATTDAGALGLVYGDDTIDVIADARERAVEIAAHDRRLALGARPRRFLHTPPPGWAWSGTARRSRYASPIDPEARIVVWPSVPGGSIDDAWAQLGAELASEAAQVTAAFSGAPIAVDHLRGWLRELEGTSAAGLAMRWGFAAVADDRAAYACYLASPADTFDRLLQPFTWLVDSITPLPALVPATALGVFAAWID